MIPLAVGFVEESTTSNIEEGLVVPIPTLPEESIFKLFACAPAWNPIAPFPFSADT